MSEENKENMQQGRLNIWIRTELLDSPLAHKRGNAAGKVEYLDTDGTTG